MNKKASSTESFFTFLSWRKHPFRTAGLLLLVLLALLISFNSFLLKLIIIYWFEQQNVATKIEDVTLSLANSKLTIEKLETANNDRRLRFERLYIDWQWSPMWGKRYLIDSFELSGLQLDIKHSERQLSIGTYLAISKTAANKASEPNFPQEKTSKSSNWEVAVNNVFLEDNDVCVNSTTLTNVYKSFFKSSGDETILCTKNSIKFEGRVTVKSDQKIDVDLDGKIQANSFDLNNKQESLLSIESLASDITYNNERIAINNFAISEVKSYLPALSLAHPIELSVSEFDLSSLQLKDNQISLNSSNISKLAVYQIQSNNNSLPNTPILKLEKVDIGSIRSNQQESQLSAITLSNFSFTSIDDESLKGWLTLANNYNFIDATPNEISFDSIVATDISFIPLNNNSTSSIQSDKSHNTTPGLLVKDIKINRLKGFLNKKASGEIPLLNRLNGFLVTEKSQELIQENKKRDKTLLPITLQRVDLSSTQFIWNDYSMNKHQPIILHDFSGYLNNLNNQSSKIDFKVTGNISRSGEITIEGKDTQLTQSKNNTLISTNTLVSIRALDMAEISSYAVKYLGYRIDYGQLNSTANILIDKNQVDSEIRINFKTLELSEVEDYERVSEANDLGVPLPTALNLIRSSDDSIKLTVPISGSISEISVSPRDLVKTISYKAIKQAIISQYTPFGLVTLAEGLIDLATGIRFDPLIFQSEKYALNSKHQNQLTQLSELAQQKPKLNFTVCGVPSFMDISDPEQRDLEGLSDEVKDFLLKLSKQRQIVTMTFLKESGISSERLIGCNPSLKNIREKSAIVSISIK